MAAIDNWQEVAKVLCGVAPHGELDDQAVESLGHCIVLLPV